MDMYTWADIKAFANSLSENQLNNPVRWWGCEIHGHVEQAKGLEEDYVDINEWPASTISKIIGYELPLFTTDPTGNLMGFEKAKAILKVIAADALIEELNRQAAPTE